MEQENKDIGHHYVVSVYERVQDEADAEKLSRKLEAAYSGIAKKADECGMVVLSTIQTCTGIGHDAICYTIAVNWMKKSELERVQRLQQLGVQGNHRGPKWLS